VLPLGEYLPPVSIIPPLHGVSPSARSVGTLVSKRTSTSTTPAGHHPEGPVMGMGIEDSVVRVEGDPLTGAGRDKTGWPGGRARLARLVCSACDSDPPHGNFDEQPPSEAHPCPHVRWGASHSQRRREPLIAVPVRNRVH